MSFLLILTQKTQYFLEHTICEYWKPLQTVLFAVWGYLAVVTVWHGPVMEHHHAKISQKSRFWWISKNSVQQARSVLGSGDRGLAHTPRRFYLSNPPMRQLRTEQNWRENCERTSTILGPNDVEKSRILYNDTDTPKRSYSNLGPTLEKAPTSR